MFIIEVNVMRKYFVQLFLCLERNENEINGNEERKGEDEFFFFLLLFLIFSN